MRIMIYESPSQQHALLKITFNICLLFLSGCMGLQQEPDLAILYNESAGYHSPDRNPIIVIPGILGSRLLYTPKGTVAWGRLKAALQTLQIQTAHVSLHFQSARKTNSIKCVMK